MPPPQIRAIEFPSPAAGAPRNGTIDVELRLADGTSSRFCAATPDQPEEWVKRDQKGYAFGDPVLFARGLDRGLLREAAQSMAADLSGYWLRYYNSLRRRSASGKPAKVAEAFLAAQEPSGAAVAQVTIQDNRIFSILAATPSGFKSAFEERSLRFYFGPSVLFLRELDGALARRAVSEMAANGDLWLCLYDTPRTTLSKTLSEFKKRHP